MCRIIHNTLFFLSVSSELLVRSRDPDSSLQRISRVGKRRRNGRDGGVQGRGEIKGGKKEEKKQNQKEER